MSNVHQIKPKIKRQNHKTTNQLILKIGYDLCQLFG